MTDLAKKKEGVKKEIRSLLLSAPVGLTLQELERDYDMYIGAKLPIRELGYTNAEELLTSIPDTVEITRRNDVLVLKGIPDASTQKIQMLVSKQKVDSHNKWGALRTNVTSAMSRGDFRQRGGYSATRFSNPRRSNNISAYNHYRREHLPLSPPHQLREFTHHRNASHRNVPSVPAYTRGQIRELVQSYPIGLPLDHTSFTFHKHYRVPLDPQSLGFASVYDLMASLTDIVTLKQLPHGETYVMSVESAVAMESHQNFQRQHGSNRQPDSNRLPETVTKSSREMCQKEKFNIASETSSVLKEQNQRVTAQDKQLQRGTNSVSSDMDLSCNVPFTVQDHIRQIMADRPNGICASSLPFEYKNMFKKELPHKTYGYNSVIEFVSDLSHIIRTERLCPEGDWRLLPVSVQPQLGKTTVGLKTTVRPQRFDKLLDLYMPSAVLEKQAHESVLHLPTDAVSPGRFYACQPLPDFGDGPSLIQLYVSYIQSPAVFWIQLKGRETTLALDNLMDELETIYSSKCLPSVYSMTPILAKKGMICAAIYPEDGHWYRAIITGCKDQLYEVYYVDYGNVSDVSIAHMRLLKTTFLNLPAQAIPARLGNIQPVHGAWKVNAKNLLSTLCNEKPLVGLVTNFKDGVLWLCLTDTSQECDIHINDIFVKEGYADFVKDTDHMEIIGLLQAPSMEFLYGKKEPSTSTQDSTPVKPSTSTQDSTLVKPSTSTQDSTPVKPSTSTQDSTLVKPSTSTQNSTSVKPSTSTQDSTPVKPSTSTQNSTPVKPSTSTQDSTPVKPSTSTQDSTPVKPSTSTQDSTPVKPSTSTQDSTPVKPSTSTQDSTPVKPSTSTQNSTPVKPSTSTQNSTPVKPSTSTQDSTPVKPSTSTQNSTLVKPSTSTQDSTPVKPSTSTQDSTPVKPSTSTQDSTLVKPSTSTQDSTPVKPSTSTQDSTLVKPSTSTQDSTLVKPSTSTQDSTPVKPISRRYIRQAQMTDDLVMNLINLDGQLYLLSSEISYLFFEDDIISAQLYKDKTKVPEVVLTREGHKDFFNELAIYGAPNFTEVTNVLSLFSLSALPLIIELYGKKGDFQEVMGTALEILEWFDPADPYWKGEDDAAIRESMQVGTDDSVDDPSDMPSLDDLQLVIHSLEMKKNRILNEILKKNDCAPHSFSELNDVELNLKKLEALIRKIESALDKPGQAQPSVCSLQARTESSLTPESNTELQLPVVSSQLKSTQKVAPMMQIPPSNREPLASTAGLSSQPALDMNTLLQQHILLNSLMMEQLGISQEAINLHSVVGKLPHPSFGRGMSLLQQQLSQPGLLQQGGGQPTVAAQSSQHSALSLGNGSPLLQSQQSLHGIQLLQQLNNFRMAALGLNPAHTLSGQQTGLFGLLQNTDGVIPNWHSQVATQLPYSSQAPSDNKQSFHPPR